MSQMSHPAPLSPRLFSTSSSSSTPVVSTPPPASKSPSNANAEGMFVDEVYAPNPELAAQAHITCFEQYQTMYQQSISNPDSFWQQMAEQHLDWFQPFTKVQDGDFTAGDLSWFVNGKLNVAYNCVDRHLEKRGDKPAIIWEGDEPGHVRTLTYRELYHAVNKCANALKELGVKKGDSVCIYMPMVPEAAISMLACAKIGAVHSVVFAGFSAEALKERIEEGKCRVVITADEGARGGKHIPLKHTVDMACSLLTENHAVRNVIVYKNTGVHMDMRRGRDIWWHDVVDKQRPVCANEVMDSEDNLFMLFTSGSTGKPKGIAHSSAGYLLYTMLTTKYVFDVHENDIHGCVADVGWITGHSYIVYGPLALGATTFMFESTPLYPDSNRYWDVVQRHKITTFYTAPTAIRALMKFGTDGVKKYDRSSLRVLGTVGEPINPEAWRWYNSVVGDEKIPIVDTYWQTETGGHVLTPLPFATPTKPGSATLPFFGIEPVLLNNEGQEVTGNDVRGVLCFRKPWPSIARTIYGDHDRYLKTYLHVYKGMYFTGDGAYRDKSGYYWITGRVDDVVNVSGHRIGSAEIESALVLNQKVAESAVVGVPHDVKGEALFAYVIVKDGVVSSPALLKELALLVREQVGSFAVPDYILICPALPKTRSGKIMRRLLRKIAKGDTDKASLGDTSTLADESVVQQLVTAVHELKEQKKQ